MFTNVPSAFPTVSRRRWRARRRRAEARGCKQASDSLAIDWRQRFGQRCHRRAAAAEQWRRGYGSSDSGEMMGGAQQCATRVASMWPREGASWSLGWENRRRSESGDDCLAAAAGTRVPASKSFGQANMHACKLDVYKEKV
jgi:hypothetical protein